MSFGDILLKTADNANLCNFLLHKYSPAKDIGFVPFDFSKAEVDGVEPIAVPVDEWTYYEIVTNIGEQSTDDWTLRLTLPDGTNKEFSQLNNRHADWRALNWLGCPHVVRSIEKNGVLPR